MMLSMTNVYFFGVTKTTRWEGGERKGALSVEDYTVGGAWLAAERVIGVVKRGTSS